MQTSNPTERIEAVGEPDDPDDPDGPDDTGFVGLVEREHRGLIAAATMIVGEPARAEEIVQEAFERTWRRWDEVAGLDRPGAWVRRVVLNEAISTTRSRGSERKALARLVSRRREPETPPQDLDHAALWSEVRGLPEKQATAVALHYGADLSIATIATEMELSDSAVKTLLHRARATLRHSDAVARLAETSTGHDRHHAQLNGPDRPREDRP